MFKNKKYDQILDILQELLARTQENKNGIARIERKVEEMRKPKTKAKSHIKEAKEILEEKRKPGRPKKMVDKKKVKKAKSLPPSPTQIKKNPHIWNMLWIKLKDRK